MYRPMTGRFGVPFVLVRGRGTGLIEKVAGIVKELERRAQVRPEPLTENFSRQMEPSRYGAALAGFIGLLALTMASIGMSGVFAYVVRQRMGEIGVRMAVGAQPWQVVRLVLASSMLAAVDRTGDRAGVGGCRRRGAGTSTSGDEGVGSGRGAIAAGCGSGDRDCGSGAASRAGDPIRALRWE
jgi:hypothetical protein